MRVEFNPYNNKTSFEAKVSEEMINTMRYYINNHPNRLKNNYKLNSQIEAISNMGFDTYTINLVKKVMGWTVEYSLVAVKGGAPKEKANVLAKRGTYKQIVDLFLNLDRKQFKDMFYKY